MYKKYRIIQTMSCSASLSCASKFILAVAILSAVKLENDKQPVIIVLYVQ